MNFQLQKELISSSEFIKRQSIKQMNPVSGGSIHSAWQIEQTDGSKLFAKTTSLENFDMLAFEKDGLKFLNDFANESFLQIPKPLSLEKLENTTILFLPWIEFQPNNESNLGKGLALLHKFSSETNHGKFGWGNNGFIGSTVQSGGWESTWGECFVKLRLTPQISLAKKWGLEINEYQIMLTNMIDFLQEHNPVPSLVHGDLWSGNASTTKDGKGIIFDPAVYWADREVDLAMTKLFGGFSNEFYVAYKNTWPLNESAKRRVNIYNLYHLLNHANMFGGSYANQCFSSINQLKELFE